MKIKNNEQGIAHLFLTILILVVFAAIGFVGYRVYKFKDSKNQQANSTESISTSSKTWKDGEFAVKGTYADADIVQVSEGQWRLYYATQPEVQGHNFEVYSATSTDGKSWKQEAGNRKTMATFPDVVKTKDGKWRMYFQQAGVIKSAISSDGLSFTDEAGTRVGTGNDEGLKFDNVAAPSVLHKSDGTYMMVYRGSINERYAANTPNATTNVLMWATSSDGLSWAQKGMAVDSRNSKLQGQLDGPDLVSWDDGKLHMFATSYDGVFEFVFENDKFDSGTKAFSLGDSQPATNGQPAKAVAPPGDPTLAKINGTWYMYYGIAFADGGIHYATLE